VAYFALGEICGGSRLYAVNLGEKVHVWRAQLDQPDGAVIRATALLLPGELEHARRGSPVVSRRRVLARAALREVLGRYLDLQPDAVRLTNGRFGKPRLAQIHGSRGRLHFNLSRSDDTCLIAVAATDVGVDIERHEDRGIDVDAFSARFFAPDETAALRRLAGRRKLRTFFKIWTLKEAFVKALGGGLTIPLNTFAVSVEGGHPRLVTYRDGAVDAWTLAAPPIDDRFVAAVALRRPVESEELSIVVRDVEPSWRDTAFRVPVIGITPSR
jgi:4'-phosphopantetheinyl transferase